MSSKINIIGDDYEVINIEEESHVGISFQNNNGADQIISCTLNTSTNSAQYNHDSIYLAPYGSVQSSCNKYSELTDQIDALRDETNNALELYLKKEQFYNYNHIDNYISYIEPFDCLYSEKSLALSGSLVIFATHIDDNLTEGELPHFDTVSSWTNISDRPMFGNSYMDANYDLDSRYYKKSEINTQLSSKLDGSSYTASDILTKLKSVDGSDSGLDADRVDGVHNGYLTASMFRNVARNSDNEYDADTLTSGGMFTNYGSTNYWANVPVGFNYGSVLHLSNGFSYSGVSSALSAQLAWDVTHNSSDPTRNLWFRTSNNLGFSDDWKQVALQKDSVSFESISATSTISTSGKFYSSNRESCMYGNYTLGLAQGIWSIGSNWKCDANGSDYGNLYGLAYHYTTNMLGGHQIIFCENGVAGASLGGQGVWGKGLKITGNATIDADVSVGGSIVIYSV